ncbi:TonB C-terminal domain-containing protein [Helicobacter turcicus]|uniref:TonB C-terminal domain-containing protein n=1 Tax=Helicobacter turcicus TaxID=2867412 RepID=A0ABS7JKZ6_9HELI|nr:TonB C-terminal domain-containing protein [Helicobacter turcicus]MBX7490067.1 TonB C-terminal domain-containing protein [Helicobacter turcicus]MBX7544926.1 TonB C-terminal domain-containing protein [Helicobacter turcicus]
MARIVLFLTSGSISISCYTLIIVLLFWRLNTASEPPRAYTAYKETTFSIDLIEEFKSQKEIKVTQKRAEKKIKDVSIKKESASVTPNVGVGINDLFKQVESKIPVKSTKPPSQNDKIAKNKKAKESAQSESLNDELQKIMTNLDTQKTLSFATPKGEYDTFYAKVHEILAQNWNPMRTAIEHFAEVAVIIDAQGKFSYTIVKKSGDLKFDEALNSFLDIMRTQEFPRYEGGDSTRIMVTFKTEV